MKKSPRIELMKDIIATISILIKLEVDGEILDTQTNLIAFLNEAGFTTVRGAQFSKMNFRQLFTRCTPSELKAVMSEFSAQNEYDKLAFMMQR